jgi:hypothetical protein
MAVQFNPSGTVLFKGPGSVAMDADCCCDGGGGIDCGGCDNSVDIPTLELDINAAAATAQAGGVFSGCNDAACQSLTGTYLLDAIVAGGSNFCGVSFGSCAWALPFGDAGSLPCVSNTAGDVYYLDFYCTIGSSGGNWYIGIQIILADALVAGSGPGYQWLKNLGAVKPDCATLFPLVFDIADICNFDDADCAGVCPCFFEDITITVDLP